MHTTVFRNYLSTGVYNAFILMTKKNQKHIAIVGAGPGGLSAALILAHRGFKVSVFEKDDRVGGRTKSYDEKGYRFDVGPTFLMMKFVLDEVFKEVGLNSEDYMKFTRLDPMYRMHLPKATFDLTDDADKMEGIIEEKFGEGKGFRKFLKREKERFGHLERCLQKPYSSLASYLDPKVLRALPKLSLGRSLYKELDHYFKDDSLKLAFTFQSKYIGMSPWECPAYFLMLPYMEHAFGIYHVEGGLARISDGLAKAAQDKGAKIHVNSPVKKLMMDGKKVKGLLLESGEEVEADEVVINADFAYAMNNLAKGKSKKYSPEKLAKKDYSCSTFMMYLGIDGEIDLPHHNFFGSQNYKQFTQDLFKNKKATEDVSFYVRNASITDSTLAPKGKSNLYVLVPVPNNQSKIDWAKEKDSYRNKIIQKLKKSMGIEDLEERIEYEKILTPLDWQTDYNVYEGAVFGMAYQFKQMLYFRPHNKFEEFDHCYLVGGGTHPGSGLPVIWLASYITANLISKAHNIPFTERPLSQTA